MRRVPAQDRIFAKRVRRNLDQEPIGSMVRTETATIVFTDLVGSTELANRLGHDAYEAMRRAHFDALRLAASQCQGTEIKSTGDGMVFTFGSAGDALACMIGMQQTTDLVARRNGGEPRIRIGASCGEINREDHDIFGICVVEAARLCAAAAPGRTSQHKEVSRTVHDILASPVLNRRGAVAHDAHARVGPRNQL